MGEIRFWLDMNHRGGTKRSDKLLVGNIDTGEATYIDLSELLQALTADDLPEGLNKKYITPEQKTKLENLAEGILTLTTAAEHFYPKNLNPAGYLTASSDLAAAKLTGTIAAARIPGLDASKIVSGLLQAARIPDLPADKITSGTLSVDRLPMIPAEKVEGFALDLAKYIAKTAIGAANGVAPLDANVRIPVGHIPGLSADKITSGVFSEDRFPETMLRYGDVVNDFVNSSPNLPISSERGIELMGITEGQEIRIGKLEGMNLIADMANQKILIKNSAGELVTEIGVGWLNNEGTTFFFNEVTQMLELKNDQGEVLSEIPASAFVSNLAATLGLSGTSLQLKDTEGNVLKSVTLQISNIEGLTAALAGKEPAFYKNTAFNMNFGVGENDVSRGNHFHDFKKESLLDSGVYSSAEKDFNTLVDGFSGLVNELSPNSPGNTTNGWWYVEVQKQYKSSSLGSDLIQTAKEFRSSKGDCFYRTSNSDGTWNNWVKILSDKNFKPTKETGNVFDLSNPLGTSYNYASASSSPSFEVINLAVRGNASSLINRADKPVVYEADGVTPATEIPGPDFVANTDLELVVETMDGVNVRYFFLPLS